MFAVPSISRVLRTRYDGVVAHPRAHFGAQVTEVRLSTSFGNPTSATFYSRRAVIIRAEAPLPWQGHGQLLVRHNPIGGFNVLSVSSVLPSLIWLCQCV